MNYPWEDSARDAMRVPITPDISNRIKSFCKSVDDLSKQLKTTQKLVDAICPPDVTNKEVSCPQKTTTGKSSNA